MKLKSEKLLKEYIDDLVDGSLIIESPFLGDEEKKAINSLIEMKEAVNDLYFMISEVDFTKKRNVRSVKESIRNIRRATKLFESVRVTIDEDIEEEWPEYEEYRDRLYDKKDDLSGSIITVKEKIADIIDYFIANEMNDRIEEMLSLVGLIEGVEDNLESGYYNKAKSQLKDIMRNIDISSLLNKLKVLYISISQEER